MSVEENTAPDDVYEDTSIWKRRTEPRTWKNMMDDIIWTDLSKVLILHTGLFMSLIIYGHKIWLNDFKYLSIIWAIFLFNAAAIGTCAGVHRMWSHRSYKANLPLRILLLICYSIAGQNTIYNWAKDHRVHHKYSDTDADPYNASRGFFFSHIGWLIMKRHPDCVKRGREVDVTDLKADPIVMFHKKYIFELKVVFCWLIPVIIPVMCWGENLPDAIMTQIFIRYVLSMNGIWCINSVAHLWGFRPYNSAIRPAENLLTSFVAAGEGSHNYHHTFPWDYKASELPSYINASALFIEAFSKIGWSYDLKRPSPELIAKVTKRLTAKNGMSG